MATIVILPLLFLKLQLSPFTQPLLQFLYFLNMSNFQIPPHADESALKKLEKKIIDEGKAEDAHVSHTLKDLSKVEKASGKADKVCGFSCPYGVIA